MKQATVTERLTFTFDRRPTGEEIAQTIWNEELGDWSLESVEVRHIPSTNMGLTFSQSYNVWDVVFRKDRR